MAVFLLQRAFTKTSSANAPDQSSRAFHRHKDRSGGSHKLALAQYREHATLAGAILSTWWTFELSRACDRREYGRAHIHCAYASHTTQRTFASLRYWACPDCLWRHFSATLHTPTTEMSSFQESTSPALLRNFCDSLGPFLWKYTCKEGYGKAGCLGKPR